MNVTGAGTLPVLTNVTRTSVYCFYTVLHFASNVKYTLLQDPKNTKNYCSGMQVFIIEKVGNVHERSES